MMPPITLTKSEIAFCRMLGNMRTMMNREADIKDVQLMGMDADEIGVIGEYAFCKLNNIFFNPTVQPRSGSYDFVFRGLRFDMKTTARLDGKLLATLKINKDVDVFSLAILDKQTVSFPGSYWARDMYRPENLNDLGHGPTYVIPQSKLLKWKTNEKGENHSKGQGGHFSIA